MSLNITYKDNNQYFNYNGNIYKFTCVQCPDEGGDTTRWGNGVIRDSKNIISVEVEAASDDISFRVYNVKFGNDSTSHLYGMKITNNTYITALTSGETTYTINGHTYNYCTMVTTQTLWQFSANQNVSSLIVQNEDVTLKDSFTFNFSDCPKVSYSDIKNTTTNEAYTYVYVLIRGNKKENGKETTNESDNYGIILAFKLSVTKVNSVDDAVYNTTGDNGNLYTYNIDNSTCAKYYFCKAIYAAYSGGKYQILADYTEGMSDVKKKSIISNTTNFYVAIIQLYKYSNVQNANYELWSTNIGNSRQVSQSSTNTFIEATLNKKLSPVAILDNISITSKDCILIYSTDKAKILDDTALLRAINSECYNGYSVTAHAQRIVKNKTLTDAKSGFNHCFRLGVLASHFGIIRDIDSLTKGTSLFTALNLNNTPYTDTVNTGGSTATVHYGMLTYFKIGDTMCVMRTTVADKSIDCRTFKLIDFVNNKALITNASEKNVIQPGTRSSKILRLKINNTSYSWFFIQPFLYIKYTENGTTKSELYYDDTWKLHENVSQTINLE